MIIFLSELLLLTFVQMFLNQMQEFDSYFSADIKQMWAQEMSRLLPTLRLLFLATT